MPLRYEMETWTSKSHFEGLFILIRIVLGLQRCRELGVKRFFSPRSTPFSALNDDVAFDSNTIVRKGKIRTCAA